MRHILPIIVLASLIVPSVSGAQETIPIPHISATTQRELVEMADRTKLGLFRVRSVSTPDGLFQPIPTEADGLAVWLAIGEAAPMLVTTYAYVSGAQDIQVFVNDEWEPAEIRYGSPLFDLTVLAVDAEIPAEDAVPLVEEWPLHATVYVPLATSDSTAPSEVIHGMLGGQLSGTLAYYTRAHFWQRNGYPIVSREGELIALTSIFAPDGNGVLAIPFEHIANWQREWNSLDPDNPYDHMPDVRLEQIDPIINGGARGSEFDEDGRLPDEGASGIVD